MASCVPQADATFAVGVFDANNDDGWTTFQWKHWPVVKVAEGRNSSGDTCRSINSWEGLMVARTSDVTTPSVGSFLLLLLTLVALDAADVVGTIAARSKG